VLGANSIRASSMRSSTRCRKRRPHPSSTETRSAVEQERACVSSPRLVTPTSPHPVSVVAVRPAACKLVSTDQENLERAAIDHCQLGPHLIGHTDHPRRQASATFRQKPMPGPDRGGPTSAPRTPAGPRRIPCRTRSIVRNHHHTCLAVIEALRRTALIRGDTELRAAEGGTDCGLVRRGCPVLALGASIHNSITR
jgi:hypothetical protein